MLSSSRKLLRQQLPRQQRSVKRIAGKNLLPPQPTGNLDSKSGGEVMELLQNVWKKMGKALVVITHDSRIARMADRQFQIVDGVLTEVTAK